MTALMARSLVIAALPTLDAVTARHVHEALRSGGYLQAVSLILKK